MAVSHAEQRRARIRNAQPAGYLRTMMSIAADRGADPAAVLSGSGLTMALLEAPEMRISAREAAAIMARAIELTGDEGLGLEFGLRMTPPVHGNVGYAAMSCATLRDAYDLIVRYSHLRQRDVALDVTLESGDLILRARDLHKLGPLRHIVYESLLVGLYRLGGLLLGDARQSAEIWFDFDEGAYVQAYRTRLPTVRYGMPENRLVLPARDLDRPLVMADPGAVRRAVEHCEREMATTSPSPENLLERVRAELTPGSDGYPDLETVASCLFMSGRSLKRRLGECGSSFQRLLDEVRHRDAQRLLGNADLSIQEIATALGYQDPPSFTRAFRRWSGVTPSEGRSRAS